MTRLGLATKKLTDITPSHVSSIHGKSSFIVFFGRQLNKRISSRFPRWRIHFKDNLVNSKILEECSHVCFCTSIERNPFHVNDIISLRLLIQLWLLLLLVLKKTRNDCIICHVRQRHQRLLRNNIRKRHDIYSSAGHELAVQSQGSL